jgi:hypothetical protein
MQFSIYTLDTEKERLDMEREEQFEIDRLKRRIEEERKSEEFDARRYEFEERDRKIKEWALTIILLVVIWLSLTGGGNSSYSEDEPSSESYQRYDR